MDIKLVVSSIVQRYHIGFDPQEDGHRVISEMQDHFTAVPGPLSLVFTAREQKAAESEKRFSTTGH